MRPRPELVTLHITDDAGPRNLTVRGRQAIGGGHKSNAIVIQDSTVSGLHFELSVVLDGVAVRDLGSKNGTWIGDGVRLTEAWLRPGSSFRVGGSVIRLVGIDMVDIPVSTTGRFGKLIGPGAKMNELFAKLNRLAGLPLDLLVIGETGTGKELVAQGLHDASPRARGPLVIVDCAALTPTLAEGVLFGHVKGAFTDAVADQPGLLEQAHGGTLFIDEIGELPLELQPKLLRALETQQTRRVGESKFRTFDARIVAATHRDLRRMVNAGEFRSDLYFRLADMQLDIPPLRERGRADVVSLADLFLEGFAAERGVELRFSAECREVLSSYPWPGNVRELKKAVRCAAMLAEGPEVGVGDLPAQVRTGRAGAAVERGAVVDVLDLPHREARRAFERLYLDRLLAQTGGNKTQAAKMAGMTRSGFRSLVDRVEEREQSD